MRRDTGVDDGDRDPLPVSPRDRVGQRLWHPKRTVDSEFAPEIPLAGRVIGVGHIGGQQNLVNFDPGNAGVGFKFIDDHLSLGLGHRLAQLNRMKTLTKID